MSNKIEENLFNGDLTEENKHQYFEIYKLTVEMADRISSRRQTANSFFLSINTAIMAFVGYFKALNEISYLWLICLAGLIISFMWFSYIKASKQLNTGKFKIIHLIEKNLILRPYDAEWIALGKGKNKKLYKPFSDIETIIPWVFFGLNAIVLVIQLCKLIRPLICHCI